MIYFLNDHVLTDYEVTEPTSDGDDEQNKEEAEEEEGDNDFSLPGIRRVKAESNEVSPVTLTMAMTPKNLSSTGGWSNVDVG